jgi:hypothetical protein
MNVTRGIQPSSAPLGSSYGNVLERVVGVAPAPLLPGENEVDYATIAGRFIRASGPQDAIEELLIRDAIDSTWEIFRLRRLMAGMLRAASSVGVRNLLLKMECDGRDPLGCPFDFAAKWARGDRVARKKLENFLNTAGLGMDDVMAEALSSVIERFEKLDRMLVSVEARRNNALREIDRHREALGVAVRRSIGEIEDAEFRDVETGEVGAGAQ